MASHTMPEGALIIDAPAHAWIVERQRRGEGHKLDSWHDTEEEAQAQAEFLRLDSKTDACVLPPPAALWGQN